MKCCSVFSCCGGNNGEKQPLVKDVESGVSQGARAKICCKRGESSCYSEPISYHSCTRGGAKLGAFIGVAAGIIVAYSLLGSPYANKTAVLGEILWFFKACLYVIFAMIGSCVGYGVLFVFSAIIHGCCNSDDA